MKKLLYFSSFLFLFSCSTKNSQQKFNEFRSNANQIELPLSITCKTDVAKNSIDTLYFEKFIPKGFTVVGQLTTSDTSQFVFLYSKKVDLLHSYLISFDASGKITDSLTLGMCTLETRKERTFQTTISKLIQVNKEESLNYYSYMQHGNEYIRGLDSSRSLNQVYTLNTSGMFSLVTE